MKNWNPNRIILLLLTTAMLMPACSQPAYVQQNNLLVANGQLDEAIANYRQLIANDPEESELYYQLAGVLYLKGDQPGATSAIEKAIIINHLIDRYQLLAGKIRYAAHDYFEAINHLSNAVTLNSQFLEAHYYLGLARNKTGQVSQGLADLQTAVSIEPLYFDAHLAWAELSFRQLMRSSESATLTRQGADASSQKAGPTAPNSAPGESTQPAESTTQSSADKSLQQLIEKLKSALVIKPDSVPGHLLLAEMYRAMGADTKATALLESWLAEFGTDDGILLALADIEYSAGRLSSALQILDQQTQPASGSQILRLRIAIRTRPDADTEKTISGLIQNLPPSEEASLLTAQWELTRGNIGRAERAIQKALELNPNYAEAYFTLSKIHTAQGDTAGAQWNLQKALQLAPANLEIRLAFLAGLVEQGDWTEAERRLNQYGLDSDHPDVLYLQGMIAMEKKDYTQAEKKFLEAARKQYAIRTETGLAELEIRQGQYHSAEQRLERINSFFPDNLDIVLARAELFIQTGRGDRVSTLLAPYLKHPQGRGRVHLLTAESQVQQGTVPNALKTLKHAIELWPRNPDLVQAYTLYLGITNQYQKAIPLLEEMQTFEHTFSQLFYYRLREYYYRAGDIKRFNSFTNRYQMKKNRIRQIK